MSKEGSQRVKALSQIFVGLKGQSTFPGPWSSDSKGSSSPEWQSTIRLWPPMATLRDTARRKPRERALDKSKFPRATTSRAQSWAKKIPGCQHGH